MSLPPRRESEPARPRPAPPPTEVDVVVDVVAREGVTRVHSDPDPRSSPLGTRLDAPWGSVLTEEGLDLQVQYVEGEHTRGPDEST